jgi:putative FmdB family regulatory protein
MPNYEYCCQDCGVTMVVQVSIADRDNHWDCSCAGTMKRVYSVPAVKFKGPGFYVNGG